MTRIFPWDNQFCNLNIILFSFNYFLFQKCIFTVLSIWTRKYKSRFLCQVHTVAETTRLPVWHSKCQIQVFRISDQMDNFFWTNFCTCSETINKFVKKTRSNEFLEGSRSYGKANEGFRTNCRFYTSDGNFSGMFTKPSKVHVVSFSFSWCWKWFLCVGIHMPSKNSK